MIRRQFIRQTSTYGMGGLILGRAAAGNITAHKNLIVGHGSHRYMIDMEWGALNSSLYPVNDCHEMVIDSRGRLLLLTNHTQNNIIIYDKSGELVEVWGTDYPGAHGLTLNNERHREVLYITDTKRHEVIKTTINGEVIHILGWPEECGFYKERNQYKPTETAIAKNGDIYVADGYGLQYILHYSSDFRLLNVFGGNGSADNKFTNAHGICVDDRTGEETLLITDRMKNQLKRFTMSGELLELIELPGAYICRPVMHGKEAYLATIWSGRNKTGAGFICILDENNKLVSAPCGSKPNYVNDQLQMMYQTLKIFQHPHDVCIDDDKNLYVAQWNSGQSYPIKLLRI